ncbi:RluA family pseudouridine synthase [candidate division KSB1 bacterium]
MERKENSWKPEILYEDNHLIIINKKPSEIVQADKTGDQPLSEKIKQFLKEKYNKPGNVFLGVVHRIDRPVSGIVIFAKTGKALERMNRILHDREIEKIYWAIVKNKPENDFGTLVHYLIKDQEKNKVRIYKTNRQNALKAELNYKYLNSSTRYHLLEVELLTGRPHQIRAQLSAIGCPIKGDLKYGYSRSNENASIHLHARKVVFVHPVSKQKLEIIANPPDDLLWNFFQSNQ